MIKELIISVVIVIFIFIGNTCTQSYTTKSVKETSNNLVELKEELMKDENEINFEITKQKVDEIHQKWDIRYERLAYYIEHNELEKVKTELTGIRGYIETKEYLEAIPEVDKSIYILEHIKDKSAFNLKNIF